MSKGKASGGQGKSYRPKADIGRQLETVGMPDATLVYHHSALFPVLVATLLVREHSRESLGEVEKVCFDLVKAGIDSVDSVAALLGLQAQRFRHVVADMAGRGLVEVTAGSRLALTETGRLSLETGRIVIDTERAFLLCATSGRLMPSGFYGATRVRMDELQDKGRWEEYIDAMPEVSLAALQLEKITDRHAVNVPPEVSSFMELLATDPEFIKGDLLVLRTPDGKLHPRFLSGRHVIDWIDPGRLPLLMEPLGYSAYARMTPQESLESLRQILVDFNVAKRVDAIADVIGNPVFMLQDINDAAFARMWDGMRLGSHAGTQRHNALPVPALPDYKGRDVLGGRTVTVKALSERDRQIIDLHRDLVAMIRHYFDTVRQSTTLSLTDHVIGEVESQGIDKQLLRTVLALLPMKPLAQLNDYLDEEPEETTDDTGEIVP